MSNICAGIGRGQMTIVNDHLAHHINTKDVYQEAFADIDGIEVHVAPEDYMEPNYWLNTVTVDPNKFGMDYEQLRQVLDKANIESRPLWRPMHMQPVFKDAPAYVNGVSEALFNVGLCLPSGPMVTDEDLAYIVETIKQAKK